MPAMQILNQVKGGLPVSGTFASPTDGPAVLVLSGSVWCKAADQMIGITLELDGKAVGAAQIFSNAASTHRAVVPSYIPVTLTIGNHTVTLVALNGQTTSDYNDVFDVTLLY